MIWVGRFECIREPISHLPRPLLISVGVCDFIRRQSALIAWHNAFNYSRFLPIWHLSFCSNSYIRSSVSWISPLLLRCIIPCISPSHVLPTMLVCKKMGMILQVLGNDCKFTTKIKPARQCALGYLLIAMLCNLTAGSVLQWYKNIHTQQFLAANATTSIPWISTGIPDVAWSCIGS